MNSRTIVYLMKVLKSNSTSLNRSRFFTKFLSPNEKFMYSTKYVRPLDILDFFTDCILEKRGISSKPAIATQERTQSKTLGNIDQIIADVDTKDPLITSKMLINKLIAGMENQNYNEVNKIIQFCLERKIPLSNNILSSLAGKYSNSGLLEELLSVRALSKISDEKEYYDKGEYLHHLALCYWVRNNSEKCIELLHECSLKHPTLSDNTKKILKSIIPQSVTTRSEAQMLSVIKFTKYFTYRFNDYYPLSVMWNHLFLSEWFCHQELSNDLLDSDENLQLCISLLVPSLLPYLLRNNRLNDVYRFLEVLLKYKLMDAYSSALQILFDHFCSLKDKNQCGEVVKSSIEMNAPLREEQYNQFISWTVFGDPTKLIKKTEIEKIYSTF